jgi:hypothetical protein
MQKALIGRLLQAGWDSPSETRVRAMEVALRQIMGIRNELDSAIDIVIKTQGVPIPAIFSDFFVIAVAEYSFNSVTFLSEALLLCNRFSKDDDYDSLQKCLLLLWANRRRLPIDQTEEIITSVLDALSKLEHLQKLTVRDKYIALFLLQHIGEEDTEQIKRIRKKIAKVRKLYPSEMQRLLPVPGTGIDIRVKGKRKKPKV